jgi:hypothetical protein
MNSDRTGIRPVIKGLNLKTTISTEEKFQNETLRPIIKMQHDLFVKYFSLYLRTKKCQFDSLTSLKKEAFIAAAFKKDVAFKSEIKGMILGHFTVFEFTIYSSNKSDFNKRILTMVQQRINSVITLF